MGDSIVGDLFGRGVQALFRNYLAGREVGIGIAALADDQRFLDAVRRLTDTLYSHALRSLEATRIIDASPGNGRVIEVIRAVYPEAFDDASVGTGAPARTPGAPSRLHSAPIFVVGVPRSGTTWLEHLLLAHPDVHGPARETSLFLSLRALHDNIGRSPDEGVAAWIAREPFIAALRTFAEELFADYLARAGQPTARLLEKTPLHAEHLPLISELFPEASIISIHRDGRDVVQSLLAMDAATDDADVAATRWAEITRGVSAAFASLPRARELRYEDLLEDPVGHVTDLMRWLDLAVDDPVLEEVRRRASQRVSQYNTAGEVGSGKWKSLSARDLRTVYRRAGERLVELGYVTAADARRGRRRWRP